LKITYRMVCEDFRVATFEAIDVVVKQVGIDIVFSISQAECIHSVKETRRNDVKRSRKSESKERHASHGDLEKVCPFDRNFIYDTYVAGLLRRLNSQ
jgi:hypothetical protein